MKGLLITVIAYYLLPLNHAAPRQVTNEDIRDAILSVVHMIRDSSSKLERHEYRERQLGEQLKKALSTLDKRERAQDSALETINYTLGSLMERIRTLEESIAKKSQERNGHIDMTMLQSWLSGVEKTLQQNQPKGQFVEKDQFNSLETLMDSKLQLIASKIENLETQVHQTSENSATDNLENLFNKIDTSIQNLQSNWQRTSNSLENQQSVLLEIISDGATAKEDIITNLAEGLREVQNKIKSELENNSLKLEGTLLNMHESLAGGQENITKRIIEDRELTNGFFDITRITFDQLSTDVKALAKVEKVLIQTADNVMDTKRRIGYGVQQILLEVGDLIKLQGNNINNTMNKRFDGISEKILDNQNGGLTNLSSKIETEISQVWRQIGIMYQQLTASAGALDKLQKQTEIYVNGSLQTMDSMEGKVGQITGRISEVDDNLNYLLGKLSLVTQEFNQIKSALANALDNIRNSFQSVQEKIKDVGPGPNPIDSISDATDVDNTL